MMNRTLTTLGSTIILSGALILLGGQGAAQATPAGVKIASINTQDYTEILRVVPKTAEDYYNQGLALHGHGSLQQPLRRLAER